LPKLCFGKDCSTKARMGSAIARLSTFYICCPAHMSIKLAYRSLIRAAKLGIVYLNVHWPVTR